MNKCVLTLRKIILKNNNKNYYFFEKRYFQQGQDIKESDAGF